MLRHEQPAEDGDSRGDEADDRGRKNSGLNNTGPLAADRGRTSHRRMTSAHDRRLPPSLPALKAQAPSAMTTVTMIAHPISSPVTDSFLNNMAALFGDLPRSAENNT